MPSVGTEVEEAGRARGCGAGHPRGFTLIELMTTLAVLIVSLTFAVPAFMSFLQGNRLRAAQSELVSSLMLARSEAARQGARVGVESLLPLADGGFAQGWRVWVDADADGAYTLGEAVMREVPARGGRVTITPTPGVREVVFAPSGFLVASNAVTFSLCGDPGVGKAYQVLLEPVGLTDSTEVNACP